VFFGVFGLAIALLLARWPKGYRRRHLTPLDRVREGLVVVEGYVRGTPTLVAPLTGMPCIGWTLFASVRAPTSNGATYRPAGKTIGETARYRLEDEQAQAGIAVDASGADVLAGTSETSELPAATEPLRERLSVRSKLPLRVTELRLDPHDLVTVFGRAETSPDGHLLRATHVRAGDFAQRRASLQRWALVSAGAIALGAAMIAAGVR
jgi:hypothetical protein